MADIEREPTGVENLDEKLEGGFPGNSAILLVGPPGSGKSTFLNQFVYHGLEQGQKGIYFTLDASPNEILDDTESFGWAFKDYYERFNFIDGYSWREGGDVEGEFAIEGPSDLNNMNITLVNAMQDVGEGKKRIVLDSVSTLILYTDTNSAVKFLQVVGAKSKASEGCLVMTIEEGVHDEQTLSTLNYVADGVMRMKTEEDKHMVMIERMEKTEHPTDWMEFGIDPERGLYLE